MSNESKEKTYHFVGWFLIFFALCGAFLLVLNPVVIVPAGHRGILLTWGAVTETLVEGLHFRLPIMQSVIMMEVRTQKFEATASAASSDLQDVSTQVALNYHINPERAASVYQKIGVDWGGKIISPAIQEAVKSATAKHSADELITKRVLIKDEIENSLKAVLSEYNIYVENVYITDFKFSQEFTAAIEKKVTSQQTKLNEEQILLIKQIQADQVLAEAKGRANSQVALAEAAANSTLLKASAEAKAIQLISEQVAKEPKYIDYLNTYGQAQAVQKWNGELPTYTGGALPILNLRQNNTY
jgi:regulator of protease activity HflC (stomatin/prohibitin superfamily)